MLSASYAQISLWKSLQMDEKWNSYIINKADTFVDAVAIENSS